MKMKTSDLRRVAPFAFRAAGILLLSSALASCGLENSAFEIVRTVRVEKGDLLQTVTATGMVQPYNRVEIKPPIAGRIEEVLVREGEEVRRGQTLARMSSVERAALLDAARAQGEDAVRRWEQAYKAAPLLAPLDGTVIVRSVEPGQTVTTADPVVVISDRLIVQALVDETDLAMIRLGLKTEIWLDAYPGQKFEGRVDHITFESKLENNVNVYEIDILPGEIPEFCRSGMTANVTFIVKEKKDVLLVPAEAVVEWPRDQPNPQGAVFAVYTKSFRGGIKPAPVRIGDSDGRMSEVLQGLEEGAAVQVVRKKEKQKGSNPFAPPRFSRKGNTPKSS